MCGIAGYFGSGGRREILQKMTDALRHRGPDYQGLYLDDKIGLGHARLSIIDLSPSGHQPMPNEDKTVWLIFNGEIYNFPALRKNLLAKHKFQSNSDSETIIHLYEEIGERVFEKLNGMFALALYDKKKNKLILARDRLGKKPLYYTLVNNNFIFGSELKSLMRHPDFKKEIDLNSLNKYLSYEYVPTPGTIFKNTFKLEPGHYLIFNGREIKKIKFWDTSFGQNKFQISNFKLPVILEELNKKLEEAVKIRLISDVPLGIFLSGGLDSSTIAYYAQKHSLNKIKTFSIGFKEKSFDESFYARKAAKFLNTEHHETMLSSQDTLDLIPRVADILDEPLADASVIPTYLLAQFTKKYVTVALGGDGGDELFCGYDTFQAHCLAGLYEKIPLLARKAILEPMITHWPVSFKNISFDFKLKKFISGFNVLKQYRNQIWLGAFSQSDKQQLLTPEARRCLSGKNEFEDIDNYLNVLGDNNFYNQLIYSYLKTYLMDDILVKVDRASMAHALEARAPLLDYQVVDYVNSLPARLKIKGLTSKYILKKLMADKLPREIVFRPKKGFGIPLSNWLTNELKSFTLNLLSEAKIKQAGLFDYQYIKTLLTDHFNRRQDNRKLIWTLMVFEMWREKWLK